MRQAPVGLCNALRNWRSRFPTSRRSGETPAEERETARGFHDAGRLSYQARVTSFRRLSLPVFLLAILVARPVFAGLSARLVYLRSGTAENCPDQAALKKAVARRLGYDPFLLSAPHMIIAEVSGSASELRARARLLDETGIVLGSRELQGKGTDCAELVASLALAISLTLDPMAAASDPGPEPPEEPEVARSEPVEPVTELPPPPLPPPLRTMPVTASAEAKKTTSLSLQAGMIGSFGWVPALSPAVELGLGLRHQSWSVGLDVVGVAPQTRTSAEGLSGRVWVAYAALSPCLWVHPVGVCALGTLGRYTGRGGGIDLPRSGSDLHAAAGLRMQAMLPLSGRWLLGVHADGVRILTRPQFLVAGQEVYRPAAWAADLGIFASWQLF